MNTIWTLDGIRRAVLERGIELRRDGTEWVLTASPKDARFQSPEEALVAAAPLRPVVVYIWLENIGEHPWLLRPNGYTFERALLDLSEPRQEMFLAVRNLAYLARAVTYHCLNLANLYAAIAARTCESTKRCPTLVADQPTIFGDQVEPYFEFDSIMAATRRLYDTTRYLLWPRFGKGGIPASLYRLLEQKTTMPDSLKAALQQSGQHYGARVTEYRHCAQHYVPVDFGQCAFMRQHPTGAWMTQMRIPDNPEARSKARFTFSKELDALTFAWEAADQAISAATMVVAAATSKVVP